jgi:hypothetical protein
LWQHRRDWLRQAKPFEPGWRRAGVGDGVCFHCDTERQRDQKQREELKIELKPTLRKFIFHLRDYLVECCGLKHEKLTGKTHQRFFRLSATVRWLGFRKETLALQS